MYMTHIKYVLNAVSDNYDYIYMYTFPTAAHVVCTNKQNQQRTSI